MKLRRVAAIGTASGVAGILAQAVREPGRPLRQDENVTGKTLWRRSKIPLIRHYGVGIGPDEIAHVQASKHKRGSPIEITDSGGFSGPRHRDIFVRRTSRGLLPRQLKHAVATNHFNPADYSWLRNNCETFANNVLGSHDKTDQVKEALTAGGVGTGVGIGGALAAPSIARKLRPLAHRMKLLSAKIGQLVELGTLHQPRPNESAPEDLPVLKEGDLIDYTVQRHNAKRAGLHRDVRVGDKRQDLLSWATKNELPGPGKNTSIHVQPTHPHSYLGWQGTIKSGYGAGEVATEHKGKLLVTKSQPNELHGTVATQRGNHRLAFIRGKAGWLLARGKHPEAPPEAVKPKYKSVPPEQARQQIAALEPGAVVQPKVDGALVYIGTGKGRPEILSHRKAKSTGANLVHTERLWGRRPVAKIPRSLHNKTLLAELYGTRGGRAIEPQELGGILNANLAESLRRQKDQGVRIKAMPFDIAGESGPYAKRLARVKEIIKHLPGRSRFHTPETVDNPAAADRLYRQIKSGRHPLTKEGVIIQGEPGKGRKIKNIKEENVRIHSTFAGKGKFEGLPGGFVYADKSGRPLGKVGSGITDQTRGELDKYIGRTARVKHQGRFKSGKLRAPSFVAVDESR